MTSYVLFLDDVGIPREEVQTTITSHLDAEAVYASDYPDLSSVPTPVRAIVTVKTPFTPTLASAFPDLSGVVVAFTGYGVHSLDLNIPVYNAPGYSTTAVAEHAIGLSLAALRDTGVFASSSSWKTLAPGRELGSLTVGVAGTGAIGMAFAQRAAAFGASLVGWSRSQNPEFLDLGGRYVASLAELAAEADVVSLHVPFNDNTAGLFGAEEAAAMKADGVLVNTARGGVVDTQAVLDEMASRIASTGSSFVLAADVFEEEPLPDDHRILTDDLLAPFLLLTHHVAYKTRGAISRRWDITLSNLSAVFASTPTAPTAHCVNLEHL